MEETSINTADNLLKKPSVWQTGMLFSFVVIIFVYLGTRIQMWSASYGVLLTEIVLILLPPIVFLAIFKLDIRKLLRLNNPGIINLLLILGIMIFALPVIGVLNLLNFWIIKQIFGTYEVFQAPISTEAGGLLLGILVIGVLAGICEEVLFRGAIQRGFERIGPIKAIVITAVLFGLMHMDFQRFLGTFLLGALMGYLTYTSNSLFSSIFAHFTNNSIAVCVTYGSLKLTEMIESSGVEGLESVEAVQTDIFATFASMSQAEIIVAVMVYTVIFTFSVIWLYMLLRAFAKNNKKRGVVAQKKEGSVPLKQFISFAPGILLIVYIYVTDILRMSGMPIETVQHLLNIIGL